jgi:hypothetical protein
MPEFDTGDAEAIVTGDEELLVLEALWGIAILTPRHPIPRVTCQFERTDDVLSTPHSVRP